MISEVGFDWATVTAAGITVVGVVAGLYVDRAERRRDRDEQRKKDVDDREHAMRRELFLGAVAAIAEKEAALVRLLNTEDDPKPRRAAEHDAAVAKLYLIAPFEAIQASMDVAQALTHAQRVLWLHRIDARNRQKELAAAKKATDERLAALPRGEEFDVISLRVQAYLLGLGVAAVEARRRLFVEALRVMEPVEIRSGRLHAELRRGLGQSTDVPQFEAAVRAHATASIAELSNIASYMDELIGRMKAERLAAERKLEAKGG